MPLIYLEKPMSPSWIFLVLHLSPAHSPIPTLNHQGQRHILLPTLLIHSYSPIQLHLTGLYVVPQRPKQAPFFLKTFAVTCSLHSECPVLQLFHGPLLPLVKISAQFSPYQKGFPYPLYPVPPFLYLAFDYSSLTRKS